MKFKAGSTLEDKEYVFYCPVQDELSVMFGGNAFVFTNPNGLHITLVNYSNHKLTARNLYLIGEL